MNHEPTSTARARRLRERRSRGVIMVAPVEVGVALLVGNGLLKEHETRDRRAVSQACLCALEQWAGGLMGWVVSEPYRFLGPDFADVFERRKAAILRAPSW